MFKKFSHLCTAAFSLLSAAAAPAMAADIDSIVYAPEIDRRKPVEIGNGWYLRGDLGYAVETEGEVNTVINGDLETDWQGGLGVGYQFTDWFRVDGTAEYAPGHVEGDVDGDFDAIGLLANAYVDLGTIAGFTPYIGAGVGTTYLDYGPLSSGFDGEDDWRFTWALMAGASYDISKSLKLDVGYRYLDVDGGNVFSAAGATQEDEGYQKHEIRAGLRYSLW